MSVPFSGGFGSSGGVDTGDIGHSLRCRASGSTYLNKTLSSPTSNTTWSFSLFAKEGSNTGVARYFLTSGYSALGINAGNQLTLWDSGGGQIANSAALSRDPTGHRHIFFVSNGTTVKGYVNNLEVVSYTGTIPGLNSATAHNLLRHAALANGWFDGYLSRIAFVDGTALTPSSFGQLNTEINEWVSKSQSAVKAVVDAGGTNSFMLDFDDATSLTTLGYDKSSKGNNWTLNNFSLTTGTTYDHMLDVPGNSYATLNNIYPSAANITNGNLTSGTTAVRATMNALLFDSKWEVTAGGSAVTAGVISGTGTTNTTSVTANKVFAFRLTTAGALDYKNVTDAGSWTSITTGLTGEQYPYGITQAANWNFGQAPLHASATYQAAAGGYFYDTTAGFKALCQANLPTPAILNPTTGFVSVLATEDNIDSNLATARSGWSAYVDIKKNRAAAETWAWQFSHDSSNEYAIANASKTYQAKRAMSGANNWVGYSIRIGSLYGTAAGSVSHTNGVATTVTHNLGTADQMVFLFPRAAGSVVPVFHPVLTAGSLLDLCGNAGQAASTAITSVGSSSFQIGSGQATGTYDYLVLSEKDGLANVFSWAGNSSADGPYADVEEKPAFAMFKNISGVNQWMSYDTKRETTNVMQTVLIPNSTAAETTNYHIDFLSRGIKPRAGAGFAMNDTGSTYAGISYADVAGKFSSAR